MLQPRPTFFCARSTLFSYLTYCHFVSHVVLLFDRGQELTEEEKIQRLHAALNYSEFCYWRLPQQDNTV